MATCTEQVSLVDTNPATSYTTASFTPPAGALLIALSTTSDSPGDAASHMRDSESGTSWTQIASANFNSRGGVYERIWVRARTAPVSGAAMTVEAYNTSGGFDDMLMSIVAVDGMALFGSATLRQSVREAGLSNLATGVPYVDFASAPLPANPILAIVANTVDPYPTTQPPSGYTQGAHGAVTDYALAFSVCFIDGGISDPHVVWTGGPAIRHNTLAVELDTTGGTPWIPPPDTVDPIWINSFEIKVLTGR